MNAKAAQQVIERLRAAGGSNRTLSASDMDLSPNTQGKHTLVAEFQAIRPLRIREGVSYDLHLTAHESFETDGTAGDTETFTLTHSAVDAESVPEPVVVFSEGIDVTADATVDFDADTVDLANTDADETVDVFYVSDEQARVEVRKRAPKKYQATLDERDASLINLREQTRDPLTFDFDAPTAGLVPTDWRVQVFVDAPYNVAWEKDRDEGTATARNALLMVPVHQGNAEVEGLKQLVADRIGEV